MASKSKNAKVIRNQANKLIERLQEILNAVDSAADGDEQAMAFLRESSCLVPYHGRRIILNIEEMFAEDEEEE